MISCFNNATYFPIIIGKKKTTNFCPSRRIRQGDPFSPYFFILAIEYLSMLIFGKTRHKEWNSYIFKNSGPTIPHLLFADDILLFSKANIKNITATNEILTNFSNLSGLQINPSKSKVWFSNNVNKNII